jgi:hypothetical protein
MDNDVARIDVGLLDTQELQEGGAQESVYTLQLHTDPPPGAFVQVNIDGHGKLVSSPTVAVLQSTAQTLTVKLRAVDDQIEEAQLRHFNVSHTVACSGAGCKFATVDVANVTVFVREDDTAGVQLSQTYFPNQLEGAGATTVYVSLRSKPLQPVTITIGGNDIGTASATNKQVRITEADGAQAMALTFTNDNNWNQQKSIKFQAYDDAVQESAQTQYTMTLSATSTDSSYNGIDVNDVVI